MNIKTRNLSIKLCYPVNNIFNNIVGQIDNIKTDNERWPDIIFYFDADNKYICEYNSKNKYFWCTYNRFWSKFYLNNSFNYYVVRYLLNDMVEEYFKLKGITTRNSYSCDDFLLEEYFKLKGITTGKKCSLSFINVEEYFKLKGITTKN